MVIRVLHLIDSLQRGGAEQQLVNLATEHHPLLVSSTVVTLIDRQELAAPLHQADIPVHTLALPSLDEWLLGIRRLRKIIASAKPHIVHTRLAHAAIIGRIAATFPQRPKVVTSVEAPLYSNEIFLDNPHQKRWKMELLRMSDMLTGRLSQSLYVACSNHVASSTARALRLSPERVRVIHNSVFVPDNELPRSAAEPISASSHVRLLNVGRLVPQKGHLYLLRALPRILNEYPYLTLQVVGRGPLEETLRHESHRLSIADSVDFLGNRDDVPALLEQANLVVLPSLWEGLSIVALEALAAGVPMVAFDIPSMREVIQPEVHGLLVEPKNPDAFANAILGLLPDQATRARISASSRHRAHEQFDVKVTAREFENLYAELLAN